MGPLLQSSSFTELAARILPALLDATMKGLLVLALAAAATAAMRRASAAARQLVWLLAIASLLVLPALSVALPAWQVLPSWARLEPMAAPETDEIAAAETQLPAGEVMDDAARAPAAEAAAAFEAAPAGDEAWAPHRATEASPAAASPAARTPHEPAMTEESPAASSPRDALPWVMLVWALGALACLAPPLLGRLSLWRLKRSSRPIAGGSWQVLLRRARAALRLARPVALLESDRRTMPMIWGIFRPTLLLPAEASDWAADRRRVVLLHELAHAKRRDCLSKLIGQLACAMYWFNPLCWLALRRLQTEAERACDDLVLNAGSRPADYAEHILEIASGLHAGTLAAHSSIAMARPRKLEGRLRAILDGTRNRRGLKRLIAVLALAAAACLVLPLAAMGPGKAKPESAPAGKADEAPATQPADDPQAKRIAVLVRQLGNAVLRKREAAHKELIDIGWPALPALRQARQHKDPEVGFRARRAVEEIERRFEARRTKLRGSMGEGYFSVPKANYLALLALPEPPLRDCYPASFVFRHNKDWPALATAMEAAGGTLRRVMAAPPKQFVRARTGVPRPRVVQLPGARVVPPPRGWTGPVPPPWATADPYVYVQEGFDGVWHLRQGTVREWVPVLRKKQRSLRRDCAGVYWELGGLYRDTLKRPKDALRAYRHAIAQQPFCTEPLETLVPKVWPTLKIKRDILWPNQSRMGSSRTAWYTRDALTDMADLQEELGDLRGALETRIRAMIAVRLTGRTWANYRREPEKVWSVVRRLPPGTKLPPIPWFNVLSPARPEIRFDLAPPGWGEEQVAHRVVGGIL